jgi:hypothetical protein
MMPPHLAIQKAVLAAMLPGRNWRSVPLTLDNGIVDRISNVFVKYKT